MNHEAALSQAKEIADRVLSPAARQNDKEGRFSVEAVAPETFLHPMTSV